MLVLSRRVDETILFPGFATAVRVVEIKGGAVRLGVDAPREVTVLRGELAERASARAQPCDPRHLVLNRLSIAETGLKLLHDQLDAGQVRDAGATLERLEEECRMLRRRLESVAEERPPAKGHKHCRALLVEDNRNERELLAGLLRLSGVEVATAGDGSDALDYLRSHATPDVVLLDMGLPRIDGPAMVREIRRNPACAGVKIFGVSGHAPEEYNLERGPRGFDRWFHKPVDPAELLHELETSACGA